MHQTIYDIAELAALKGLTRFVLSPGSRPAPLTLAIARNQKLQKWVIPDERAAAFVALGIADSSKEPVGLLCTSGSAGLNYYPAIAEAFYREIPLVVFTADRPPEWIDQMDGQTIRQKDIYQNHIKGSFSLPVDTSHPDAQWQVNRMVNEAINLAMEAPPGPVHINMPIREPLYPEKGQEIKFSEAIRIIESRLTNFHFDNHHLDDISLTIRGFKKILIAVGQADSSHSISELLHSISEKLGIPVLADIISNVNVAGKISSQDLFFGNMNEKQKQQLQPDLLITLGKSFISKNFKTYIRKYKPKEHWHIQMAGQAADTFQCLNKVIRMKPVSFLKWLNDFSDLEQKNEWKSGWAAIDSKTLSFANSWFERQPFSEVLATHLALSSLPNNCILHLSNSMPVRYANFFGSKSTIEVKVNRGTSGIDGCSSAAVGNALSTDKIVTLITGDMAFFYDRNAFWHNYTLPNLRIILMNNHAGGIFRMLPGAKDLPELGEYFETNQALVAKNSCSDFNIDYQSVNDMSSLQIALKDFFESSKNARMIEIKLDSAQTAATFEEFKLELKKHLEND